MHLFVSQKDVNDYLADLAGEPKVVGQKNIFAYGTSTILYVDPFDFGTVEIPKVSAVLKNHYCELISSPVTIRGTLPKIGAELQSV